MSSFNDDWQEGAHRTRSFLLRCWLEADSENDWEPGDTAVWRFAVVKLGDQQTKTAFSCVEDLAAYLLAELAQADR